MSIFIITELQGEFHEVEKQNGRTDKVNGEAQSAYGKIITYGDNYVGKDRHEQPEKAVLNKRRNLLLTPSCANETDNSYYRKE